MELFVYSRRAIEAVKPHDVPHVIISITSSPDDVARLRTTDACRGILRLSFLDAETPSEIHPPEQLFSEAQAARVWDFVGEHQLAIERIVVHCDAGLSRSPAVAAALSRVINGEDAEFFGDRYCPNMLVYRTLLAGRARPA